MRRIIIKWSIIVGLLILLIGINFFRSYHGIRVKYFLNENESVVNLTKFVILADLHDYIFDDSNDALIEIIISQNPDAILMIGDMLNKDSESPQNILDLIEKLVDTAPVYYAMGNHELEWQRFYQKDLKTQLWNAGAIVLNESYVDIKINGQNMRIGGIYDYAFGFDDIDLSDKSNEKVQVYNFLTEFQDTDAYKIMLSHRPDSFIFGDASTRWDIDLVVSGHLHGGQVVLPLLGGVYGGDQGYFPEYVHGLYKKDNINLLITSGLSTSKQSIPRWNNPPEIVVLEIK